MEQAEADNILGWLAGGFNENVSADTRLVWYAELADKDYGQAMETATGMVRTGDRFPTIAQFRYAMRSQSLPARTEEEWRNLPPEKNTPPRWTRGWAIARFRDSDLRCWPEQKQGYDELDRAWKQSGGDGPSGYEWDPGNVMSAEDRERYEAEGDNLDLRAFWQLVKGMVRT